MLPLMETLVQPSKQLYVPRFDSTSDTHLTGKEAAHPTRLTVKSEAMLDSFGMSPIRCPQNLLQCPTLVIRMCTRQLHLLVTC